MNDSKQIYFSALSFLLKTDYQTLISSFYAVSVSAEINYIHQRKKLDIEASQEKTAVRSFHLWYDKKILFFLHQ